MSLFIQCFINNRLELAISIKDTGILSVSELQDEVPLMLIVFNLVLQEGHSNLLATYTV